MNGILTIAAALQLAMATHVSTAPGVFIDDDPPTPGKVDMLPANGPHPASFATERIALETVEHLVRNADDADLARAKVVTIEATRNAAQTPLDRKGAAALLASCHTTGVAQLSATGKNGRHYAVVRVDCSNAVFDSKTLLAAVGVEETAAKTVFLNVGPLLSIQVR